MLERPLSHYWTSPLTFFAPNKFVVSAVDPQKNI